MPRFYLAQDGHVVNILPPINITGGVTAQTFHLKFHELANIIVQVGISAGAPSKILVNACSDAGGDNATAIPFDIYTQETAGENYDVLSGRTAVTAAGYTPSGNDDIFYVLEVLGANLPAGKPYVELEITNTAQSVIASAVAVLSGSRYASDQSETVTT